MKKASSWLLRQASPEEKDDFIALEGTELFMEILQTLNESGDKDFTKKMLVMVMLQDLLETNGEFIIEKIMMFGSFIEDCIKSFHPDAVELSVTIIDILT